MHPPAPVLAQPLVAGTVLVSHQTPLLTIYHLQIYGRRKRSAAAQLLYAAHPYFALPALAPLVAHPNGAVVPAEPLDVRRTVATRA